MRSNSKIDVLTAGILFSWNSIKRLLITTHKFASIASVCVYACMGEIRWMCIHVEISLEKLISWKELKLQINWNWKRNKRAPHIAKIGTQLNGWLDSVASCQNQFIMQSKRDHNSQKLKTNFENYVIVSVAQQHSKPNQSHTNDRTKEQNEFT